MTRDEHIELMAGRALSMWGDQAQLAQVVEELAELIVAVSHLRRQRDRAVIEVVEEIADVTIMLAQLRLMLPEDYARTIDAEIDCKLARLEDRIDEAVRADAAAEVRP